MAININDSSFRNLYTMEDESNPTTSKVDQIHPSTVLDQVFDQNTPDRKNLRKILADLKQDIVTGGKGTIVFPVTSVNGYKEDVILTKDDLELGNVDNTADRDKPLSNVQRASVLDILSNYDFGSNLSNITNDLTNHIKDYNNPHKVGVDQINKNGDLDNFVSKLISIHNTSIKHKTHPDIRRNLSAVWNNLDHLSATIGEKISDILKQLSVHLNDRTAHIELFDEKENVINKLPTMLDDSKINLETYPSSKAVRDYIETNVSDIKSYIESMDYITEFGVIDTIDNLPNPSDIYKHHVYFINKGETSYSGIAACVDSGNGEYTWNIHVLGSISKYDDKYFKDTNIGLSLDINSVTNEILNSDSILDAINNNASSIFNKFMNNYYTKTEIDNLNFVKNIDITQGTSQGSIRYSINDGPMSDDIRLPGLQRLAFLEWVTENEIKDLAVQERHIFSNSIATRHYQDNSIQSKHLTASYNTILGNTNDAIGKTVNEIPLSELAKSVAPLVGSSFELTDRCIENKHLDDNVISDRHIPDGIISSRHLQNNSVRKNNIANDIIENRHIEDQAITNSKIYDNTIDGNKLHKNIVLPKNATVEESSNTYKGLRNIIVSSKLPLDGKEGDIWVQSPNLISSSLYKECTHTYHSFGSFLNNATSNNDFIPNLIKFAGS